METKIQFAFCVALLFLGLAGAVAWRNATRGAEAFEAVEHTHKVMAEIETVMIAMLTIENGMNRFVATGEAKFLEPGYHAREVVSQSLAKLKQLTQDNPRQQKRLEQLESLTAQCRVNMAQVIRTRRTNEIAAKEIILVEKSKLLNDGIQTLINEMEEEETQLQRQRGEAVQAAAQASIRLVEAGGLVAVLITGASGLAVLRVTRRRVQADRALRESKESLAVTLQSIGDGVLATDAEARITRLNAVAEALTGWKETEAIGRPVGEIFRIVNEATRQPAFLPVADTLAKGTTHGLANHTVLIARDGMERHIADSCAPIRGRDGKVLGAVLVFRDVSQERATERLMAQATAETRDLYNHAPCGYHSVNADGVFVSINDTELNWLGYTREELIGQKKHRDLVSLDTRPTYDLGFQHFLEHGEVRDLEFKQVHKDGTERYVLLNATCVRDEMGRLQHSRSTLFDITERKQMEARLEHERYLLRTLMDNMPASIYFKDERSRFLRTNQALARRIGLDDPALMTGKTDADYFSPEHAAKALADEQRVMQSGQMINQEERESLPDGRVSWLLTVKLPLRDEAGRIVGTFGVSHDITARKQTEAALEQERHLFHTLMDNIPASIYFKDEESRFLRNNRAHA